MAARSGFDQELARLDAIRADPDTDDARALLSRSLAARSNFLVARAADIIGEWGLAQYAPEMSAAFDRFLIDAARRDPTCAAKYAVAEAINRLEVRDEDLFRCGLRFIQMEPVWGGQEDTAARLRAVCALGLARCDPPDVLLELAGLLADNEADARTGAVRAIAYASRPGGAPLLWYKSIVSDPAPAVMFECYAALLALEPERALTFVRDRARDVDPAQADAALLALGNSHLPGALPFLIDAWKSSADPAFKRVALLSIATLNTDEAFAFLLDLFEESPDAEATIVLNALAVFKDDTRRRRKIDRAMRNRGR